MKGYRIGKKTSIGFGSVIVGENVSIGDHFSLGFFSFIRGKNVRIGDCVQIGAMTFIDTPTFEIGDGSRINEQVYVGGLQFPDSKLIIGRNCQIMQMSFINPARSISIGDDSGIGGDCLLFGHTSWLSQLEGYPVNFEPIEIGRSVSLAWRVFVLPGTKIGDGAVIGANSLVNRKIPSRCLAIGFPAKVVSAFPDFPKDLSREEKVQLFRKMVEEMIGFFLGSGLLCEGVWPDFSISTARKRAIKVKKPWRLRVELADEGEELKTFASIETDVYLSFSKIPSNERRTLDSRKVSWFDVEAKEMAMEANDLGKEVAIFLRRYGIRFIPVKALNT